MDIFELIKADHRKVADIFLEIGAASDLETVYSGFNQLYQELIAHAQAEEKIFYPALQRHLSNQALIEEAEKEHGKATDLMEEINSLTPVSLEFKNKIRALQEAVLNHVQKEETEVFAKAREYMNEQELQQLAQEFKQAKNKLQKEIIIPT